MDEQELRQTINRSLKGSDGSAPGFDETWIIAESRYRAEKRRYRRFSGIAAAVALGFLILGILPDDEIEPLPELNVADSVMSTTVWFAPSDAWMPTHEIDLYEDLPEVIRATESGEETLL